MYNTRVKWKTVVTTSMFHIELQCSTIDLEFHDGTNGQYKMTDHNH